MINRPDALALAGVTGPLAFISALALLLALTLSGLSDARVADGR